MESVTREKYAAAIKKLLPVAMSDTGQSGRCAQVLLSAYSGSDFQVSIPDLCAIDDDLYDAALTVIRGRCQLRCEPSRLIEDGNRIFNRLCNEWWGLHVKNRGKVDCPSCGGRGMLYRGDYDEEGYECPRCGGYGRICDCNS